ncbi:MAG: zinc-binding dehydrogenase [Deltaproteobacteria bacterium]
MKTTAAVLTEINRPLQIEELKTSPLKKGQVLVQIAYSGICRSQLNEIQGLKGEDKFLPHTLGHEGSGIVLATGPGVTKVAPGDHAVLTWMKGSGQDAPSTRYFRNDGSIVNSGAISTFLTHAVISENRLVPVAKEMPLQEAALLGCAVPTGAGIIKNTAQLRPGQSVAVFGCGGIGLSAILMADCVQKEAGRHGKEHPPSQIIALDISEAKLSLAVGLGATHTVNVARLDAVKSVMEITAGLGVDFAVEAAGIPTAMEAAFRSVRANGGLCILAGNLPQGMTISIDPFELIKGKRIVGSWGGQTDPDRDIQSYISLYSRGDLPIDKLHSLTYRLESVNEALQEMRHTSIGRSMISFV